MTNRAAAEAVRGPSRVRQTGAVPTVDLPAEPLTEHGFAPFGHVIAAGVDAPPGALDLSGGTARFWVMPLADRPPVFDRITRHRRVTQCLAAAGAESWLVAVAAPGADPAADPGAVRAFIVPAGTAVLLHRGTWHAGPFFAGPAMSFFNLELADTNTADHDTASLPVTVRVVGAQAPVRVLVVANRTAASPELQAELRRRVAEGNVVFRVLVPTTSPAAALNVLAAGADPLGGTSTLTQVGLPLTFEAATREAHDRLEALLAWLAELGVEAEGEVGCTDPLEAIDRVLAHHPVDEILLSTLPAGLSRWLSRDLPSRCAKRFGVKVTHVEARSAPPAPAR